MAAANSSVSSSQDPYLQWRQRPASVQYAIDSSFNRLRDQTQSGWGLYNGSSSYGICRVDEEKLAKTLIQAAPATQKEFYFLDIGAGEFQWGQNLAKYLNQQKDLPLDVKMHIVNVRGERHLGDRVVTLDRCTIYNLGGFKVEEITSELRREGLAIENKVDLAITRWCFRHLVDPVGTFVQIHDLLRPGSGTFLFDGFFFTEEGSDSINSAGPYRRLTQLMLDTKAPYLTCYTDRKELNQFAIQRPSDTPCQLPLSYVGTRYLGDNYQVGSQTMTHFKREGNREVNIKYPLNSEDSNFLYGDKSLYDWFKSKEILNRSYCVYRSVRENEVIDLPFHRAIFEGDQEKIASCIEQRDLLDVSDLDGDTPLHYSVLLLDQDFCQTLLAKGANIRLANSKGHTPLHEAAIHDKEGFILKMLLSHGASIDARSAGNKTPLDAAIEAKNPCAVEILLAHGALPSASSVNALTDACFTSHPSINAFIQTFPKEFYKVLSKIEDGHYVVLQKDDNTKVMFQCENGYAFNNWSEKFITIKLPLETDLSPNSPWLKFLRQKGHSPAIHNEIKEKVLKHEEIDLT